jgi:DNA-binding CsgD family transcriptional regulator/Tfp pilus assembly protein PilF
MLEQRGVLRSIDAGWWLGDIRQTQTPPLVRQVIEGRLTHLDAQTRSALDVAAVIGQSVPLDLWSRVTGLSEEQLDAVTVQAVDAALLVETADGRGWQFNHALVHDTFYERMTLPRRRQWHRRVAEALEALDEPDAATLARHFDHAGDQRAVEWHLRAGERAQRLYATQSAAAHFTAVLDAPGTTVEQRLQARRSRGRAYETLGEFDAARQDFDAAIALARQSADTPAEVEILLDLGMLWASRNYDRAGDCYRRALDLARAHGDLSLLARTLNYLGNWHANSDLAVDALRCHREALALFETLEDRQGVLETLDLLGMTSMFFGDTSAATGYYQRSVALAREMGDRKLLSSGLATLALAPAPPEFTAVIPATDAGIDWRGGGEEALAVARDIGWRAGETYALLMLASGQTSAGQYGQALRTEAEVIRIASDIGHLFWLMCAHEAIGVIQCLLLNMDQAQASLDHAARLAQDLRAGYKIRSTTALLALVTIELGDLERADALLRPQLGQGHLVSTSISRRECWLAQAALLLAKSDPATALDVLDRLIDATPHMTTEHISPLVARLRAEALLALGRPRDAETQLLAGCRCAIEFGSPGQLWRTRLALGRLYLSKRRHDDARRELGAARGIVDELARNTPEGDLRDNFLRRAIALFPAPYAAASHATSTTTANRLSPRETEVLALLVQGSTDQEIADALSIRHRTVTTHVASIFNKLGVNTRTAAANLAIRHGLV